MSVSKADPRTNESSSIERRSILVVLVAGCTALLSGAMGLAAGFLSNALGRTRARPWLRIGPAEDLDPETFQNRVLHAEHQHAWIKQRSPLVLFVKDLYPKDPIVLLSTCSHLGCSVLWNKQSGHFECPCHGGAYDEEGRVVAGPPPEPLTRLEVKIEGEICFARLPARQGERSQG